MIGTFKIDRSFFGHILEAQLIAVLPYLLLRLFLWLMEIAVVSAGFGFRVPFSADFWAMYLACGALGVAFYVGREKRDCETGLRLPAGSPLAWYLMWIRWPNLTDVGGPILAYAIGWAVYLSV